MDLHNNAVIKEINTDTETVSDIVTDRDVANGGSEAIQLLDFNSGNECSITDHARSVLSEVDMSKGMVIISIIGKYRTGKSYFLNVCTGMAHKSTEGELYIGDVAPTFNVNPSVSACTKGLWFRIIERSDGRAPVMLIDTEGMGAPESTTQRDRNIICLSLLLSSMVIFNTTGAIDSSALNTLSHVALQSNMIMKSTACDVVGDGVGDGVGGYMPTFMWLLRDFSLELENDNNNDDTVNQVGKISSASEYMEKCLTTNAHDCDAIRKHFSNRVCKTIVAPNVSGNDNSTFFNQIQKVAEFTLASADVKRVRSVPITSAKTFLDVLELYVNATNSDVLPDIQNVHSLLSTEYTKRIMESACDTFDKTLQVRGVMTQFGTSLKTMIESTRAVVVKKFNESMKCYGNPTGDLNANIHTDLIDRLNERANAVTSHQEELADRMVYEAMRSIVIDTADVVSAKVVQGQFEDAIDDVLKKLGPDYRSRVLEQAYDIIWPVIHELVVNLKNDLSHTRSELKSLQTTNEELVITHNAEIAKCNRNFQELTSSRESLERTVSELRRSLVESAQSTGTIDIHTTNDVVGSSVGGDGSSELERLRSEISELTRRSSQLEMELQQERNVKYEERCQFNETISNMKTDLELSKAKIEKQNEAVRRLRDVEIELKSVSLQLSDVTEREANLVKSLENIRNNARANVHKARLQTLSTEQSMKLELSSLREKLGANINRLSLDLETATQKSKKQKAEIEALNGALAAACKSNDNAVGNAMRLQSEFDNHLTYHREFVTNLLDKLGGIVNTTRKTADSTIANVKCELVKCREEHRATQTALSEARLQLQHGEYGRDAVNRLKRKLEDADMKVRIANESLTTNKSRLIARDAELSSIREEKHELVRRLNSLQHKRLIDETNEEMISLARPEPSVN